MQDGAGHTVPALVRTIDLTTDLGTIFPTSVTLDANGIATATLTSAATLGTATVTATEFCNFATNTTVQFAAANLSISKSATPAQVAPGGLITYTILYTNSGNQAADNVIVTDTLPNGTLWENDDAVGQGFTRAPVAPTTAVTWGLGTVPTNTNGAITLVARVQAAPSCAAGLSLTNRVAISSSTMEADNSDNSFTHTNGVALTV